MIYLLTLTFIFIQTKCYLNCGNSLSFKMKIIFYFQ